MPKTTKPDPDLDPALQGEGNYSAARRHRKSAEAFVKTGKVPRAARAAAPQSPADARELLDAEQAGLAPTRK